MNEQTFVVSAARSYGELEMKDSRLRTGRPGTGAAHRACSPPHIVQLCGGGCEVQGELLLVQGWRVHQRGAEPAVVDHPVLVIGNPRCNLWPRIVVLPSVTAYTSASAAGDLKLGQGEKSMANYVLGVHWQWHPVNVVSPAGTCHGPLATGRT